MRIAMVLAVLVLGISSAACVVAARPARVVVAGPVIVARPPPPLRVEVIPAAPVAASADLYAWQPGHWRWEGQEYAWIAGRYELRPTPSAVWVPDEWVARRGRWVFRPGHWVYR